MKAALLIWTLLLSSCAMPSTEAVRSRQKWATLIADERAKEEGQDLTRYRIANVTKKKEDGRAVWLIAYVLKGTARPGGHFDIEVEEGSGTSRFIHGR